MTTPELLQFIRIEHALGMSFSEIIQLLINEGGWDKEDVFEAFRALGLPEEAVESFFVKDKIEVAPVLNPKIEENVKSYSPSVTSTIKEDKPEEILASVMPAPEQIKSNNYVGQASPMHYVEEPEKIEKPTLARPASLTGQASRPLVRTLSNAASYAKIDKSRISGHEGSVVHVSKLEAGHGLSRHSAESYPAEIKPLQKDVDVSNKLSEIERSLSFGMDIRKEEPKPKSVVSPSSIRTEINLSEIKPIKIDIGGEIKEVLENKNTETIVPPIFTLPLQKVEETKIEQIVNFEDMIVPPPPPPEVEHIKEVIENKVENISDATVVKEEPLFVAKVEVVLPKPLPEVEHIKEVIEKKVENTSATQTISEKPVIASRAEVILPSPLPSVSHIPRIEEPVTTIVSEIKPIFRDALNVNNLVEDTIPKYEAMPNAAEIASVNLDSVNITAVPSESINQSSNVAKADIPNQGLLEDKEIKIVKTDEGTNVLPTAEPTKESEVGTTLTRKDDIPAAIFTPPSPGYVQPPPQYIQLPPQQIFVMPPQMYQQQMAGQMPGQAYEQNSAIEPKSMMDQSPHIVEIKSTAPELEEQAYLAQFGQAKMPEALIRPQPSMVAPTIIYATQVAPNQQDLGRQKVEVRKSEPIRFDIGRLRTAHKADQSAYSGRPSIISAVSAMPPVVSKSIEEIFTSPDGKKSDIGNNASSVRDAAHSIKIPHKRTMATDLMNVEEGVSPSQNVSQSLKGRVDVSNSPVNTVAATVDDEPIPPPPPKKSTKSILIISLVIVLVITFTSALAYYFIVLRLPSASEVYKNALGVAIRGPAIIYDASLSIHAKSTNAEPEYIDADLYASGTLSIRDKGFEDGNHEIKVKISHTGIPGPINFDYYGNVSVTDDEVLISQKTPSRGTKIENILKENEWLKISYRDIGKILSLSSEDVVSSDDYGQISQRITLFKLFTLNSPIITDGELTKFKKEDKEYYKIPIKLDIKKMVLNGDSLSKYFRGGEAIVTGAERSLVLENRYSAIKGEVIVEKLSMKPISLSLYGKFDPSKIDLDGELKLDINFNFSQMLPVVKIEAGTYDELLARRASEASSEEIIKRDRPFIAIAPILDLAIKQYYEKIGKFPIVLEDLITSNFISKDAITTSMKNNIFYSSYVEKPKDLVSGVRCQAKNNSCSFYHLGINLEYRRAIELQRDADIDTSVISGGDDTGCHNETGLACYDLSEDKNVDSVAE